MASNKAWLAAQRAQSALRYAIDSADFVLRHHVPFAGFDSVLCAGCPTAVPYTDCPHVVRLAKALGVQL